MRNGESGRRRRAGAIVSGARNLSDGKRGAEASGGERAKLAHLDRKDPSIARISACVRVSLSLRHISVWLTPSVST